ncbi:MAG TPA: hypothetical protein VJH94_04650 [Candidatus Paceibacterota bacterium]
MKTFDYKKFTKKYLIKLTMKILDIIILFTIGYALGLKLIRY